MAAIELVMRPARYLYLAAFFALLAGVFHPFVAGSNLVVVIVGILVLFAGLAGCILLYKGATIRNRPGGFVRKDDGILAYAPGAAQGRRAVFLGCGFALAAVSVVYVYDIVVTV